MYYCIPWIKHADSRGREITARPVVPEERETRRKEKTHTAALLARDIQQSEVRST